MKVPWLLVVATALLIEEGRAETSAEAHFLAKVKPLLDSRCVSCHGPDKVKANLRLDSRAAALKGGDSGPVFIPGKPGESLLLQAVMHTKPDLEMPPKEKLTKADIAALETWIRDGAPWPETAPVAAVETANGEAIGDAWSDPRNPIVRIFGGQRLDLWSLKPIRHPEPPAVKTRRWVRNPIDQFVLAQLEKVGRQPSVEADRRALCRRLYYDLTGLPPTSAEVQRFLNDKRSNAYETLVDDLLASPRYGEQQARQWLDVIRYSDSNGFDWDEFRPKAWRFRDYVIRSFNADKPFDQFVREQLAGDELLDGPPATAAEQDLLVATGYLRLGPQDNSAGAFNEQDRARAEWMSDLVETTGNAFLGMTLGCCRCHDHKYDPLSQADHYRIRAFFEPVKYGDDIPLDLAPEQAAIRDYNKEIDAKLKPLQEERAGLLKGAKERSKKDSDDEAKKAFTAEEKKLHKELGEKIAAIEKEKRPFTTGLLATDNPEKVPVTKILFQGDHKSPRAAVQAGFLSALDPNPASIQKPRNPHTTGRRLTLANWIISTNNPLTARVLVNRAWQSHFGEALARTPNDFGLAGLPPGNPEVLDWLATEFVRQNWSVKKLHRLIVTSATYRQSARADSAGDNALLARQNLRRLSAEQLRDSVLAVSGLLRESKGGPPIWPDLPPEILQANPAFLDDNAEKTKAWYASPKSEQPVRGVYLIQKRTVRVPFMETFDLPQNSVSCPRRAASIVPPQALALLNGELTSQAAEALAAKTASCATASQKVQALFLFILQRGPSVHEQSACEQFLASHSVTELSRALLNVNEFIYID